MESSLLQERKTLAKELQIRSSSMGNKDNSVAIVSCIISLNCVSSISTSHDV